MTKVILKAYRNDVGRGTVALLICEGNAIVYAMQTIAIVEVAVEKVKVRSHFHVSRHSAVVIKAGSGLLIPYSLS